jgi:lipopolysaccharide biosynthesis glycosyltransferase
MAKNCMVSFLTGPEFLSRFDFFADEIKKKSVNMLCCFIRSQKLRFKIRRKLFPLIKYGIKRRSPSIERKESVNIAFCFDENVLPQARVAITSLLYNSGTCRCNIFCVVSERFPESDRDALRIMVEKQDPASTITFIKANKDFDRSFIWKSIAVYYRLMLPRLLPKLDRIIYADVDIIFCDSLAEINRIDLGSNLIAGVKDIINLDFMWPRRDRDRLLFDKLTRGEYLNSGFLLMNLKELRSRNLYVEWVKTAGSDYLKYPDQDILNYTCEGKKLLIPLKYNFIPQVYPELFRANLHSPEEYREAILHPVVLHYSDMTKKLLKEDLFLQYARMAGSFSPVNG